MNTNQRREELYVAIIAYEGDDFESFLMNKLEKLTPQDLAIPQQFYDALVNPKITPSYDPAVAFEAFESFLIDHHGQNICSSCGQSCEITVIDNGGQARHVDLLEVSKCCEEALA
jgi:hypothetical protein